jgi:hypothetical protein
MKIRLIFTLLVLGVSVFSCMNKASSPPKHILPKHVMEDILVEMCLIEGEMKVLVFTYPIEDLKTRMNTKMEDVFKENNTNYDNFTESFSYYMSDSKSSKKIMENVTNRLIKLQTEETGKKSGLSE